MAVEIDYNKVINTYKGTPAELSVYLSAATILNLKTTVLASGMFERNGGEGIFLFRMAVTLKNGDAFLMETEEADDKTVLTPHPSNNSPYQLVIEAP